MSFAFIHRPSPRTPLFSDADYAEQRAFFSAHSQLAPTPLRRLPALARALGLAELTAKDETSRFGLNAFKAAGAFFAVSKLVERGRIVAGDTLACASEGNHGRAVARAARHNHCQAVVYAASDIAGARADAIEAEGARIVRVEGGYDAAVRRMTDEARRERWTIISDTAGSGDDLETPRLIMLGYTRLMDEAEAVWSPGPPPDLVFVPAGVGGLLAAVASWCHWRFGATSGPRIVAVEPSAAACVLESVRAGHPVTLPGPFHTSMAGLRCGEVSRAAFDTALGMVSGFVAIDDRWAAEAMRRLRDAVDDDGSIEAGASGSAALGGLMALVGDPALAPARASLELGPASRALILVTEGITDPSHDRTLSASSSGTSDP